MTANLIKAPNDYSKSPHPWIFLAGSIELGKAEDWQAIIAACFDTGTVLNPRRDDWDASWEQSIDNPQFKEQVDWELTALENSDIILFYFSPGTQSPITLLELGLVTGYLDPPVPQVIVCCPEGFWRKGNVDIVCERYGLMTVESLEALCAVAKKVIA